MANTMRDHKVEVFLADPLMSEITGAQTAEPKRMKFVYKMYLTASPDASDSDILEEVFYTFNMNHPADYRHRSFSVGDVVTLDSSRSYVCATVGWQPLDFSLRPIHN